MLRYVLFDLDGTLTESGPGIMKGVQYALHAFGIEERDETHLARFVGPPLKDAFMQFYGFDEEDALRVLYKYREFYHAKGVYDNAPYPGVGAMLKNARDTGLKLAIASSKPQNMVEVVLDYFGLADNFDFIVCGTDAGPLHTKAGVVKEALRTFAERDGLTVMQVTARAVMVGDRKHDIEGAKENNLRTIGVSWGYAPQGELEKAGADRIVDDAEALTELLKQMKGETE